MALWNDQTPGTTVLSFNQSLFDGLYTFEIDIVERPEGTPHRGYLDQAHPVYRFTMGTLFEYREIMQSTDLRSILTRMNSILQAPNSKAAAKLIAQETRT